MKKLVIWLIAFSISGYFGAKFMLHSKVSSDLDMMLLAVRPLADVDYTGISSTITGELSIDGISVNMEQFQDPLYIDKVAIITPGFWYLMSLDDMDRGPQSDDIPESLGFMIGGLRARVDADYFRALHRLAREELGETADDGIASQCVGKHGFSPDVLKRLGYDDIVMDMWMQYEQDDGRLLVEMGADVEDMYEMEISMTLDGGMSTESLARGTYRPKMIDGRVEYIDQSLDERTTDLCRLEGLSDEQIVTAKLDAFAAIGEDNGVVFDELVIAPYREFLAGKSTFVIMAEPHEPVNLSQIDLYKPADVPALLNLTAEAH